MYVGFFIGRKRYIIVLAAILTVVISIIVWLVYMLTYKKFHKGINVEGVNLYGLSVENANHLVDEHLTARYANEKIYLKFKDKIWTLELKDISHDFITETAIGKAYGVGRHGSILGRVTEIVSAGRNKVNFIAEVDYDRDKLRQILELIKPEVDSEEKDAYLKYINGKINFSTEVQGILFDIEENLNYIDTRIIKREFGEIDLQFRDIVPMITYDKIKDIDSVLDVFTTTFNKNDVNRTHNIKLACEKINGKIVLPGEVFSMNQALGPRTIENGYKDAPVIYKNELVKGPGGGVCQVSTTLYNTILRSKLHVVERAHHSMPLGYVDPGRDATIAEGSIDFKFQNNKDYPVCIWAEVSGNVLRIRILGKNEGNHHIIKLSSQIVQQYLPEEEEIIYDDTIPIGEKLMVREARKGLKVIVYRETYSKNGELLDKEKISEDFYKPLRGIVKINSSYYNENITEVFDY